MKFVKAIPMAIVSIALALAALGNLLLASFGPYWATTRYILGVAAFVVLLVYLIKIIFHFPHAREEFKTPIPLSVLPTATMALMLLSAHIRPYLPGFALGMWYASVGLHLLIMLFFIIRFVPKFKLGTVFPSWFIVAAGIITTSVTAPAMSAQPLGQVAFYVGVGLYVITLIAVVARMANKNLNWPEPARHTIAIFTAPMSLAIVGYFSSFAPYERSDVVVFALIGAALVSYLYVTLMMVFKLLPIKFYPTYAAFTFPYVISALAFRLANGFLTYNGIYFFTPMVYISLYIAIIVVAFVILHYIRYFKFWVKF